MANVFAYRDAWAKHSQSNAPCHHNAYTHPHTVAHPGDARPQPHSHIHAPASSDVDSSADIDAVSDAAFYPYKRARVDIVANRSAWFHAYAVSDR